MRKLFVGLFRLVLVASLVGVGAFAIRELIGLMKGEPRIPTRLSSFDSWPAVPEAPAPTREASARTS